MTEFLQHGFQNKTNYIQSHSQVPPHPTPAPGGGLPQDLDYWGAHCTEYVTVIVNSKEGINTLRTVRVI